MFYKLNKENLPNFLINWLIKLFCMLLNIGILTNAALIFNKYDTMD